MIGLKWPKTEINDDKRNEIKVVDSAGFLFQVIIYSLMRCTWAQNQCATRTHPSVTPTPQNRRPILWSSPLESGLISCVTDNRPFELIIDFEQWLFLALRPLTNQPSIPACLPFCLPFCLLLSALHKFLLFSRLFAYCQHHFRLPRKSINSSWILYLVFNTHF